MNTDHVKEQSNSSQGIKKENSSWKSLQPNCNVVIGSKLQFQTKKCAPLNLPGARGGLKLFPWEEPRLGTGGYSGAGLGSVTAAGGQGMAEGSLAGTPMAGHTSELSAAASTLFAWLHQRCCHLCHILVHQTLLLCKIDF